MVSRWIPIIVSCLLLGHSTFALGEDTASAEPQNVSSPERVQIYSIGGRAMANHPPVINVLPGEQISLRADVIQAGNACPHPEGCPEGRGAEEFHWSANDRADDECSARRPETCRDHTAFQPEGNEMIFHIPYAMGHDITVQVSHENLYSSDMIILHNAHYGSIARQSTYPATPQGYYEESHSDAPLYPTLAPSGINEPYYDPYYHSPWWDPYPYPYAYWSGWGWGWGWRWAGPGWTVGVGFGFGPAWGWGWGWGWGWRYGGWHPGIYGFYHPGWSGPRYGLVSGPRFFRPAAVAVGPRMVQQRFNSAPMNYGARPGNTTRFRRRRGGGRR